MERQYRAYMEKGYRAINGMTRALERELSAQYAEVYKSVAARIASLYGKIGDTPTLQEARRYNRLKNLLEEIGKEYRKLTGKVITASKHGIASAYSEAAYRTEWAIDQATGIEIAFSKLPVEGIRAAVYSSATGQVFSKRIRDNSERALQLLGNTITQSLIEGKPYAATARAIRDRFQGGYNDAMRVVRTESHRAMTLGHLESFDMAQEAGVKARKRWVATLDEWTRDAHRYLDGEYADDDGLFWIGGDSAPGPGLFARPENSINCRCAVIEEIEGLEPSLRREAGGEVIPYTTYDKWLKSKEAEKTALEKSVNIPASKAGKY